MLTLKNYDLVMERSFGDWILEKMQEWEREKGERSTITAFAKYLGVSQPTISSWINESRKPSGEAALRLAKEFNDYEILELLSYSVPDLVSSDASSLPPELKISFDTAVDEIERAYKTQGITDLSSEEALVIAKEILEKHGWTVTT